MRWSTPPSRCAACSARSWTASGTTRRPIPAAARTCDWCSPPCWVTWPRRSQAFGDLALAEGTDRIDAREKALGDGRVDSLREARDRIDDLQLIDAGPTGRLGTQRAGPADGGAGVAGPRPSNGASAQAGPVAARVDPLEVIRSAHQLLAAQTPPAAPKSAPGRRTTCPDRQGDPGGSDRSAPAAARQVIAGSAGLPAGHRQDAGPIRAGRPREHPPGAAALLTLDSVGQVETAPPGRWFRVQWTLLSHPPPVSRRRCAGIRPVVGGCTSPRQSVAACTLRPAASFAPGSARRRSRRSRPLVDDDGVPDDFAVVGVSARRDALRGQRHGQRVTRVDGVVNRRFSRP